MLHSFIRANKKYHPQKLLEECKYEIKNNKLENLIDGDFDSSSSDEADSQRDSEPGNESDNNEYNESKN